MRTLSLAHRVLVIHGNYLDDEEIGFLGRQRQMAVVYCPRTHAWFGHARYPLEKLLAAWRDRGTGDRQPGVIAGSLICWPKCGTSRSPEFPTVGLRKILELGTLGRARALPGLDSQIGPPF